MSKCKAILDSKKVQSITLENSKKPVEKESKAKD